MQCIDMGPSPIDTPLISKPVHVLIGIKKKERKKERKKVDKDVWLKSTSEGNHLEVVGSISSTGK